MRTVLSIGPILLGLVLITFASWVSKPPSRARTRTWGFHFGDREVRMNRVLLPLIGSVFISLRVAQRYRGASHVRIALVRGLSYPGPSVVLVFMIPSRGRYRWEGL